MMRGARLETLCFYSMMKKFLQFIANLRHTALRGHRAVNILDIFRRLAILILSEPRRLLRRLLRLRMEAS